VTQVIIMGGIDLSSGSVVGMTTMIAASLAQVSGYSRAICPNLTGLNRSSRSRPASSAASSSTPSTAR
jgi:ribose/xylose/arabinose/galactoside ABC-type transport system permease subunit